MVCVTCATVEPGRDKKASTVAVMARLEVVSTVRVVVVVDVVVVVVVVADISVIGGVANFLGGLAIGKTRVNEGVKRQEAPQCQVSTGVHRRRDPAAKTSE